MHELVHPPEPLREHSLLADGERGALVGPRGDIAFLCAPRWHDDAVFCGLLGGRAGYAIRPRDARFVRDGHYERDSLIWRSRWVSASTVIECRDALAFPGDSERAVLLRRVEAVRGTAQMVVQLECRAEFGARPMSVRRRATGLWEGGTGDLRYRWSGAPEHTRHAGGQLVADLVVPEGRSHDLVLEIAPGSLPDDVPDPSRTWQRTERGWTHAVPPLDESIAPRDSRHSYAVLRGLTSSSGAMVAAATTALPERAGQGRNYDYRYAWIRDQCFAGQAAAAVGGDDLLDCSVRFIAERVLEDGPQLRPAYTVTGGPVPDERRIGLPGYPPGAPVRVGNRVNHQFQLDVFGEALLLLARADAAGRLDETGRRATETLVAAIEKLGGEADAGIWELDDRRWAHSRLACAAGLRAIAARRTGTTGESWSELADRLVDSVDADCRHRDGRWQRSPEDPAVDASLLLPGIRGAVPPSDPRHVTTWQAVRRELSDDGYVYRFRQEQHAVPESAFVLSGFHMALASLQQGEIVDAVRWFERNRTALSPAGLFSEEFDVVQRQLRGNLPQAFVHAVFLETAHRLGLAGVPRIGSDNDER